MLVMMLSITETAPYGNVGRTLTLMTFGRGSVRAACHRANTVFGFLLPKNHTLKHPTGGLPFMTLEFHGHLAAISG